MKTKILLLLFVCVFLSAFTLLAISIFTFKNDKMAYIFETIGRETELVSKQIASDIKTAEDLSVQYLNFYFLKSELNTEDFNRLKDKMKFDATSNIQYLCVFKFTSNNLNCVFENKKTDFTFQDDKKNKIVDTLKMAKSAQTKIIYTDDEFFYQLNISQTNPETQGVLFVYRSMAFKEFLSKNTSSSKAARQDYSAVVNHDMASVRFKDLGKKDIFLEKFPELMQLNLQSQVSQMIGVTNDISTEKWMYSLYPIAQTNLNIVSLVTEKKAMAVMTTVYKRVSLTFLIVIGVILIIGVLSSLTLTNQLQKLTEVTRRITKGDFDTQIDVKGQDEVAHLSQDFNSMTVELKRLMSETAEKARMENELKTAQLVQESLFPTNDGHYSICQLSGYYQPASECGGDWWFHIENGKYFYVIIADATGHGVPAALMTSAIKSAFSLVYNLDEPLSEIMAKLNGALCEVGHGKVMMTAFLMRILKETYLAEYVNASHEAPIIVDMNIETIDKASLQFLNETNSPRLGENKATEYKTSMVQLKKNYRVFFYTDGIYDLKNEEEKKLTERLFLKNMMAFANERSSFAQYNDNIKKFILDYHKQSVLDDDITICNLEVV